MDTEKKPPIAQLINELLVAQLNLRKRIQHELQIDQHGMEVMIHLSLHGPTSPKHLAIMLDTSTAATSLVLQRLEALNHITRQPHPHDGRKIVVIPSAKSIDHLRSIAAPVIMGTQTLVEDLSPSDQTTVALFIEAIIDLYKKSSVPS